MGSKSWAPCLHRGQTKSSGIAKQNIGLNRKVLADLAMNNPQAFEAIINSVK